MCSLEQGRTQGDTPEGPESAYAACKRALGCFLCFPMLAYVECTRTLYSILGLTIRRELGLDLDYEALV